MTWRSPDTYQQAGTERGTATSTSTISGTTSLAPALRAQLDDIRALKDDAERRSWSAEAARHERVIEALDHHLHRLDDQRSGDISP